jgi:hypothetical protein
MSIKIMNRVWQQSHQKGSALLLMLAIADNCDDSGIGWPGVPYLSRKTRMSERQTQRLVQTLDATDELAVVWSGGRGKSHLYYITSGLDPAQVQAIKELVTKKNAESSEGLARILKGKADEDGKGDNLTPPQEGTNGDNLTPPVEIKGDILTPENGGKGDIFGIKGDTAMSPEPLTSLTINTQEEEGTQLRAAWESVADQLRFDMPQANFNRYVAPLKILSFSGGVLCLAAPDETRAGWARDRIGKQVSRLLTGIVGQETRVEFVRAAV